MARPSDDDSLEPILPRHPPTAPADDEAPTPAAVDEPSPVRRLGWDRLVLVGCADVATLALVVCAVRLSSIASDQRLQACQVRIYAEQQVVSRGGSGGASNSELRERFAECLGIDLTQED